MIKMIFEQGEERMFRKDTINIVIPIFLLFFVTAFTCPLQVYADSQPRKAGIATQDNDYIMVTYSPDRKSKPKEWKIHDENYIKQINSYLSEYQSFPKFDFAKFSQPLSGGIFTLYFYYPNGDSSLMISVFEEGAIDVTKNRSAEVYEDANRFYNFLLKENLSGKNDTCLNPKLTVVHAITSGIPSPGWQVCDAEIFNQYKSFLKDMVPSSRLRACG